MCFIRIWNPAIQTTIRHFLSFSFSILCLIENTFKLHNPLNFKRSPHSLSPIEMKSVISGGGPKSLTTAKAREVVLECSGPVSILTNMNYLKMYPYLSLATVSLGFGGGSWLYTTYLKAKVRKEFQADILRECYKQGKTAEECKKELAGFLACFDDDVSN